VNESTQQKGINSLTPPKVSSEEGPYKNIHPISINGLKSVKYYILNKVNMLKVHNLRLRFIT
jgi:hypothetical protein